MRKSRFLPLYLVFCIHFSMVHGQNLGIQVRQILKSREVQVLINDSLFTALLYPDSIEKPVLYPIIAPDGQEVTRGFPRASRAHESTDHPHHVGLWFNYENVNGLDFWNNSFAIPTNHKSAYGRIVTDSILEIKSGKSGLIKYAASWQDQKGHTLLTETTCLIFNAGPGQRIIDRICTLTALEEVHFPDAKDGMLGIRVARELQMPSADTTSFSDAKGNRTRIPAALDPLQSGNYITSEGKTGNQAWGTRGKWCLLFGKMSSDSISILMIDHPRNPGYPTYWHARGYGLFAANPLGEKIFSQGKEELQFKLSKGESVIFRHRIVIASGNKILTHEAINKLVDHFSVL